MRVNFRVRVCIWACGKRSAVLAIAGDKMETKELEMNERNLGRFRVDQRSVRCNPDEIAHLFMLMKCVPIRLEVLHDMMCIEYTAISDCFSEVPVGQVIPGYDITVIRDAEGCIIGVEADDSDYPCVVKFEALIGGESSGAKEGRTE